MIMFERKQNELPPLLYKVGDKIMGYHSSIGGQMLVGGTIIEVEQSTSYLSENSYHVELEPELCEKDEDGKVIRKFTWWINEKEAKQFNQEIWNKAVKHWLSHLELKGKSYLEYIRMHRSLRGENSDISDEQLEKELDEKHKIKG